MTVALDRQSDDQPGAPTRAARDLPRRPAAAVAAAVLGFEFATLYLLGTLLVVLVVATQGLPADDRGGLRLLGGTLGSCLLAGLLLAGGVAAIRGTGRVLLLVATAVETALVLAAGVGAALAWPAAGEWPDVPALPDLGRTLTATAATLAAGLLAVLALRLVLVALPSVGRWLRAERAAVPGTPGGRARGRAVLAAVLLPAVALAAAAVLAVLTAPTSAEPASATAGAYQGHSDWGATLYAGGAPLSPPVAGDPLYSAAADADARSCTAGDMGACDALFATSPVDDVYEWFGSSCAGRLDHESDGGCVAELGAVAAD
jgi:hypothetical protein